MKGFNRWSQHTPPPYLAERLQCLGVHPVQQVGLGHGVELVAAQPQPADVAVVGGLGHGVLEEGEDVSEVALARVTVDRRAEASQDQSLLGHRQLVGVAVQVPLQAQPGDK